MNKSIGDDSAISFAAYFYSTIACVLSIKEAFEQSKVSLMLEGIPEENIPELIHQPEIYPTNINLIPIANTSRKKENIPSDLLEIKQFVFKKFYI